MDYISINNNLINYRNSDYQYESYEKIDNMCVHIFMGGGIYAFVGSEVTINGFLCNNSDEIISKLP
jgi:hypothetical protein